MTFAVADAIPLVPPKRRPMLGELNPNWHCTIVGTCLTIADLRGVADKLGYRFPKPNPTDYEIHTGMIRLVSQERNVAKALHKVLDRKFAASLNRFRRASSPPDLEALWLEALDKGEVAGACWALMSHPVATEDLRSVIFGELHMLSHQVGASARADIRRLHVLERERSALEDKVARQQGRLASEIGARDGELRDLRQRLEQEMAESRRLAHAACGAVEIDALRAMVGELQRHLSLETEARKQSQAEADEARRLAAGLARDMAVLKSEVDDARTELAALERRAEAVLVGDGVAECDRDCGRPDLCGRCILFVGGRAGHVQHLRKLVEKCNGTLMHHDGGFEDGMGRLSGLFGQADAVMVPVDCVSHMAHDQVKRLCKRWEKPFVPVPRSGLGAFMRALETVGLNAVE